MTDAERADNAHRLVDIQRGNRLVLSESGCLRLWTVVSGMAATCISLADGRRQIIALEMPGSLICAMSAQDGLENWVEMLSDCRICDIDLSRSSSALRKDADFLAKMFGYAHERLANATRHTLTLGRLDSVERTCAFLASMARRIGRGEEPALRVSLPMSRVDIADYLGLNAETVSRVMSRIKRAGLVIFDSPTEYIVPDLAALEQRVPTSLGQELHGPQHLSDVVAEPLTLHGALR